ncbi:MAG: metallophosphoesterase [Marinifilaceae bacterium]
MKTSVIAIVFTFLLLPVIDLLLFFLINKNIRKREYRWLYWLQSLFFLALLIAFVIIVRRITEPSEYMISSTILGVLTLIYIPKLVYILFGSISLLFNYYLWLGRTVRALGVTFSMCMFIYLGYTLTLGRYQYKEEQISIEFNGLPHAFNGFTIVQLSDLHLGSHSIKYRGIKRLVNLVNKQEPDIIVFTGDMVNNFAIELAPWVEELAKMKAKYGKYAVMGNHDYGDYTQWLSKKEYNDNITMFNKFMTEAGFIMLNNDYIKLCIDKDTLYLAGVENWGRPPFKQYGNLKMALRDRSEYFTILLSHDPSHWEAEVLEQKIPLTLSGHTHAMQMGIKYGKYKWTPSQYIYRQFDGLYRIEDAYINVNRGQGYLGYPGRIGIPPQVDIIKLSQGNNQ